MAIDKVVAPLLRVPLLVGLKPLQLTELARQAERVKFRSGDIITRAGALGDGAYLIVSGEVERVPEPGSLDLPEPVEPGSLVGELAMFVEHVYGATVVARGRVHCLKLTRAALHEQMCEDATLAQHFASVIDARVTFAAEELRRIALELNGGDTPAASEGPPASEEPPPAVEQPHTPAPEAAPPAATGTDG
jgi:CRP/FNR family transcriptional regulator, cyclic AMP receptor protein